MRGEAGEDQTQEKLNEKHDREIEHEFQEGVGMKV